MRLTLLSILTFSLLLCSVTSSQASEAVASIGPSRLETSTMDAKQKDWLEKFYNGTFYADGWNDISKSILSKTPQHARETLAVLLEDLGFKIGAEWAKENDVRKIDTSMLKTWGDDLQKAAKKSPEILSRLVAEIDSEVDKILE